MSGSDGRSLLDDPCYVSPAPVATVEFFPNGTGQETSESGSGTLYKKFEWQEDADVTSRFRDGNTFEDGERVIDTDGEAEPEEANPW